MVGKRPVGRPRNYDDDAERRLILDAAYAALRDRGREFRIADVLAAAGVSTRSFYRHFASKDALLCAMYLRDAGWAAQRLTKRLADATSPVQAVEWWIDEIFSFVRVARRAERVAVLGSIIGSRAEGAEEATIESRRLLIEPLTAAIEAGQVDGSFVEDDRRALADLVAAAAMNAAGLSPPFRPGTPKDLRQTIRFCLRALGADVE